MRGEERQEGSNSQGFQCLLWRLDVKTCAFVCSCVRSCTSETLSFVSVHSGRRVRNLCRCVYICEVFVCVVVFVFVRN